MSVQIIRGNARHLPLADDTVDLVVTSPPYFGLRSYQDGGEHYSGQIGDEPTPAEFVDALLDVTRECVRVLKPCGSLWVNLGDKYDSGTTGYHLHSPRVSLGRPKSLIGIPWRYALRCIDDLGLILRAEVIWSKPNGLPESVTDRVRRSHEQWFHFTLQPRYFSAVDEVREPHSDTSAHALSRHNRRGGARESGAVEGQAAHALTSSANPLGKLPGSVWTIPTQPLTVPAHLGVDHFAAFPMEWPRRIIRGWSPAGVCEECGEGRRPVTSDPERIGGRIRGEVDVNALGIGEIGGHGINAVGAHSQYTTSRSITGYACACPQPTAPTRPSIVLDPFGGTGTTALVAHALGRHGISVDMSADYCRLAEWRTSDPGQLAAAMQVDKPAPVMDGQLDIFGEATA